MWTRSSAGKARKEQQTGVIAWEYDREAVKNSGYGFSG
jgi:hypothetical protein